MKNLFEGIPVYYKYIFVIASLVDKIRKKNKRVGRSDIYFFKILAYLYSHIINNKIRFVINKNEKIAFFYVPINIIFGDTKYKDRLYKLRKKYKGILKLQKSGDFLKVFISERNLNNLIPKESEKVYYREIDTVVYLPTEYFKKTRTLSEIIFVFYSGTMKMNKICFTEKLFKDLKLIFNVKSKKDYKYWLLKELNKIPQKFMYPIIFCSVKKCDKKLMNNFKSMEQKLIETNIILQ